MLGTKPEDDVCGAGVPFPKLLPNALAMPEGRAELDVDGLKPSF